MRKQTVIALSVLLGVGESTSVAQEEDGPLGFNYATYYVCDVATQGNMDNVVETNEKPVLDKWVEDGKILGWGYLSHFTGGRWRRVQYHVSTTMEEALNNQGDIFREIYSDNRSGAQARAEACEAHDDYIWRSVTSSAGSGISQDRGKYSMSTYHICDMTMESRADDLVKSVIGPVFDEVVAEGKLGASRSTVARACLTLMCPYQLDAQASGSAEIHSLARRAGTNAVNIQNAPIP